MMHLISKGTRVLAAVIVLGNKSAGSLWLENSAGVYMHAYNPDNTWKETKD